VQAKLVRYSLLLRIFRSASFTNIILKTHMIRFVMISSNICGNFMEDRFHVNFSLFGLEEKWREINYKGHVTKRHRGRGRRPDDCSRRIPDHVGASRGDNGVKL
jgi:hypothetical protein